MHAKTLEYLISAAKKGGKALDIGVGSGYISTALAIFLGEKGQVHSIDHI
jgi:tRNA A58 N-methylase Trm61